MLTAAYPFFNIPQFPYKYLFLVIYIAKKLSGRRIRRLIYTTNPIEGFHRQVRKYTKTKGAFTSEMALLKLVYCAIQNIKEKWTMCLRNWAMTLSQLDIYFPGRLKLT